jgi:CTP synthase
MVYYLNTIRCWESVLKAVHEPLSEVTVALVGKYVDLPDAYLSVTEALRAGGFAEQVKVIIKWVASDLCETEEGAREHLGAVDAICVPGGFGIRGLEGKLGALKFARENGIPTLGLCLGLQCMVIEYARNVVGLEGASSTEFDPETKYPVIATMAEQVEILASGDMGHTMRLGLFEAQLTPGSVVAEAYGKTTVLERHRHRYEVNNSFRDQLSDAGLSFSGLSPNGDLVEFVELPKDVHPYYVSTQAHPEFLSRPTKAHPLFHGLIKAVLAGRLFGDKAE